MATKQQAMDIIKQLSQDDLKEILAAGNLLVQHPEEGIGTNLFESVFHLVPQPCVELAIVDKIGTPSRVLIIRRDQNALTDPGRLYCPGSYIRKGETSLAAVERCAKRDLGPNIEITDLKFATQYNNPEGCSGEKVQGQCRHTVGLVHLVQISGEPTTGVENKWADFIPGDLLLGHQSFLRDALGWEKTNKPLFGSLGR